MLRAKAGERVKFNAKNIRRWFCKITLRHCLDMVAAKAIINDGYYAVFMCRCGAYEVVDLERDMVTLKVRPRQVFENDMRFIPREQ